MPTLGLRWAGQATLAHAQATPRRQGQPGNSRARGHPQGKHSRRHRRGWDTPCHGAEFSKGVSLIEDAGHHWCSLGVAWAPGPVDRQHHSFPCFNGYRRRKANQGLRAV